VYEGAVIKQRAVLAAGVPQSTRPAASRDLAAERPAVVSGMAAALAAAQRTWTRQTTAAPSPAASPDLLERLAQQ
jgi:hypothetical protein